MNNKTTALRSDVAAVWGAFLFEGLMVSAHQPARATEILDRWGDTCTELVRQACEVLPAVWKAIEPYWESQVFDRPGEFETEVISELGSLMGDYVLAGNSRLPPEHMLTASIESLVNEFVRDYEIIEPEEELAPELSAIWGAFFYEGLFTASNAPQRADAVRNAWGQGHVELVSQCCNTYLPEVWRQVRQRWHTAEFPGVFAYEVISELGMVVGDFLIANRKLPDTDTVPNFVHALVEDFFNQSMKPPSTPDSS